MPSWFAVIPPGLESALSAELREQGVGSAQVQPGGARFQASLEAGARLSSSLRTPSRLLVELGEGRVLTLEQLGSLARSLDWRPYLEPGIPVQIECSIKESRIRFSDAASSKVEHAIADALRGPRLPGFRSGRPPDPQRITVRIQEDVARLSVDAGGDLLHTRGWRQQAGKAPIRENLASALLYVAGWRPGEPLLDPFCGAGTIPVEAALRALGRPPAPGRRYAWHAWPALRAKAGPSARPRGSVEVQGIFSSDKDSRAVADARDNALRAGVSLPWSVLDVGEITPPCVEPGFIVTNPPYGERLGQSVEGVYTTFGRALRERFAGWRVLFLAPHAGLAQRVHRDARRLTTFSNGGIRVGAWAVEL